MSSSTIYTLHYFQGRGRAEVIRLIFAQAGQKFEDRRHTPDEWAKLKSQMPLGQMPVLEFDGEKLPQSMSISRYLARKFQLNGKNDLESTKCDVIVDTIQELNNDYYRIWFHTTDEKLKETEQIKFKTDVLPQSLKGIETLMNQYGNGTWAVGNKVTWTDLLLYDSLETFLKMDEQIFEKYPTLKKNFEAVQKLPNIAEYLANSKETPV